MRYYMNLSGGSIKKERIFPSRPGRGKYILDGIGLFLVVFYLFKVGINNVVVGF
jgi:hypothetical protein